MSTRANEEKIMKIRKIARAYLIAKHIVIKNGFEKEIDWQHEVSIDNLSEQIFLSESAWVILNSGMREEVIRKKFGKISEAFYNWKSASLISENNSLCREEALICFNNKKKIEAILCIAKRVSEDGFKNVYNKIKVGGVQYLMEFPFIGPITSIHLAKNIGLSVAKPDRHLNRIVKAIGYEDSQHLCEDISQATDDPVQVVDIVLWRYSTLYSAKAIKMAKAIGSIEKWQKRFVLQ